MLKIIKYIINKKTNCWEFSKGKDDSGYGCLKYNGIPFKAHRLSWTLNAGPIPQDMYVLHKCDNRSCVNPKHLFIGTHRDNMGDMAKKGRANRPFGEKNGRSKLTLKIVNEIRYSFLMNITLAEIHGVTKSTIGKIRNNKLWSHELCKH